MRRALSLLALLLALGAGKAPAARAQQPLEPFLRQVARLWDAADADGLVDLVPDQEQVLLDTGRGTEMVQGRHAVAALRALFGERESVSVRTVRGALAGGQPARGFGELAWVFRTRGAASPQSRSVYVGTVWNGRRWQISEIRLMP